MPNSFKILMVNTCTYRDVYVYPIGLDYIKSYLEQHGYTDIDTLDLALVPESKYRQQLSEKLFKKDYDLIAFSFRNVTDQLYQGKAYVPVVKDLISFCKKVTKAKGESTPIVVGGAGFSLLPERMIELVGADYGIAGEGETALLELVEKISQGTSPSSKLLAKHVPFDTISYRRGTWGYLDDYQQLGVWGNIQTKRGCSKRCIYCSYPVIEGKLFRFRDPDLVAKEALQLQDLGFDKLYIVDATFNHPLLHAKWMLQAFKRHQVTAEWKAFFTPAIDQELIDLIKATNYSPPLKLTIESGSDKMLDVLKKDFTVAEVKRAVKLLKKNQIPFAYTIMFGAPGETQETVKETLDFILETQPEVVTAGMGVFVYPNTSLATMTKNKLWKQEDKLLGTTFVPYDRERTLKLVHQYLDSSGIEFVIYDELQQLNQRVM